MAAANRAPLGFRLRSGPASLAGEQAGEGPPVALLHGLTATRRYVLHGSNALARRGHRVISFDARGHGESDPAPEGSGYGYGEMAADLDRLLGELAPGERVCLAGDSMGAHTATAYALDHADELAALIAIRPSSIGLPPTEDAIAGWDRLADGLEREGVEGFVRAYDHGLPGQWRDTLLRISRQRLELHDHLGAVAAALRQVPRSLPFEGIGELEGLNLPVLVVASRDDADPQHPYSVGEAWAETLPEARLISEQPGQSPLAWQGGRLSRAIADFLAEPAVSERLR